MSGDAIMQRHSIHVPGMEHKNPIPAASRIGPFLMSGLISGQGATVAEQAEHMFAQLRRILEATSASPEHVIKVTVWMADRTQRPAINPAWIALFPDEHSRPARQTMTADLDPGKLVQCDFIAMVPEA